MLKSWQGFIFCKQGGSYTRSQRLIDDGNAKDFGIKTLKTSCKGRRIYFHLDLWVDRDMDEVAKFLDETYDAASSVFCTEDPLLVVKINDCSPTLQVQAWPDEISHLAPPKTTTHKTICTAIVRHLVTRYLRIQDLQTEYYVKDQDQQLRLQLQSDTLRLRSEEVRVLREENAEYRKHMAEFEKKYNDAAKMHQKNVELRHHIILVENTANTLRAQLKSAEDRCKALNDQVGRMAEDYERRFQRMDSTLNSTVKHMQNDLAEWTESALECASAVFGLGKRPLATVKSEPEAKRRLFRSPSPESRRPTPDAFVTPNTSPETALKAGVDGLNLLATATVPVISPAPATLPTAPAPDSAALA